jgi:hypothetical protein
MILIQILVAQGAGIFGSVNFHFHDITPIRLRQEFLPAQVARKVHHGIVPLRNPPIVP